MNLITKAHLKGIKMYSKAKYQWQIDRSTDLRTFDEFYKDFLTTYTENLLKAVKEAGPGELEDSIKNDILFTEAKWFNDCRSSFISAIDEGIEGIRKGEK